MTDEPWAADIEAVYQSVHELTPSDERHLEQAGFSEDRLRDAFYEGFMDSDADPADRHDARETYFEWMEYLGYDSDDFDWEAWRDWAGYNND